jgi:XTP/dITP diphosphohydrolase
MMINNSDKIVLASGNKGKIKEFSEIFAQSGVQIIPQTELQISDAEETGLSFVENAIIKARHAAKLSGLPALADDSGIAVDYLGGAPGIHSARFAGEHGNDAANNQKLLEQLKNVPDAQRGASFHCVLVLLRHANDPVPYIFHGEWRGKMLTAPQGENGFGYDPLFFVPEHQCSSAQLSSEIKNKISHRAKAVQALIKALNG